MPKRYWVTVHWPPHVDKADGGVDPTIYIVDGRESAAKNARPGDLVFVYETKQGRHDVVEEEGGKTIVRKRGLGRQGIIALGKVTSRLRANASAEPSSYSDGTSLFWRWHAEADLITAHGFVPRASVNGVLGFVEDYSWRAFGQGHSGLKEITKDQYRELLRTFKAKPPKDDDLHTLVAKYGPRSPKGGIESESHRMLKEYVAGDPEAALGEKGLKLRTMEFRFPTGDKADVVLEDRFGQVLGVEIEVDQDASQLEGLLQAIKYRFMLAVMTERPYVETRAILVAFNLSKETRKVCGDYDVECFTISREKVQEWWNTR